MKTSPSSSTPNGEAEAEGPTGLGTGEPTTKATTIRLVTEAASKHRPTRKQKAKRTMLRRTVKTRDRTSSATKCKAKTSTRRRDTTSTWASQEMPSTSSKGTQARAEASNLNSKREAMAKATGAPTSWSTERKETSRTSWKRSKNRNEKPVKTKSKFRKTSKKSKPRTKSLI